MSIEGLSRARLGGLHDVIVGHVERGGVPGEDLAGPVGKFGWYGGWARRSTRILGKTWSPS